MFLFELLIDIGLIVSHLFALQVVPVLPNFLIGPLSSLHSYLNNIQRLKNDP